MRKLIWLFLIVAITGSVFAAPATPRSFLNASLNSPVTTQYRVDAGRTGASSESGPTFLETEVWTRPLAGPVSGLVYDRGILYAGALGGVYAVSPATGADLWVFAQPNVQFSPVAVVDDTVYVAGGNVLYALNRATGALLWSFATDASIAASSPLIVDGVGYVGSSAGTVYAIDLDTHAELWSVDAGSAVVAPLVSSKNVLLAVTDDALVALNIQNGNERWSREGDWGPAAATQKFVYSGLTGGAFSALDLNTGKIEWESDLPQQSSSEEWGGPAVFDGVVAVGNGNGWLYTIDAETGGWLMTMLQTNGMLATAPIVAANGFAYFGYGDDPAAQFQPTWITSFDMATGIEYSQRVVYGHVTGDLAIGGGVVFVHDSSGTLSAFRD